MTPARLVLLLQALAVALLLLFTIPLLLPGPRSIGWWLMQIVPLLLLLPRLHREERRPLQWLGFLVLFYFTAGVLQASGTDLTGRVLGLSTVLCCVAAFVAAIMRLRHLR